MTATWKPARVEGGLTLLQDDDGRVHVTGQPPREFEAKLLGRRAMDAVYLTQQIGADDGISHALAAILAWEQAGAVVVAENGRLLRELLHALSLAHAHVRHFYVSELPDYLPWGTLVDYAGSHPVVRDMRAGAEERPRRDWMRQGFEHPFTQEEVGRLWEHRVQAGEHLAVLQRMLALLGGKYPVAMSIVPGGLNVSLSEQTLLRMRGYLAEVRGFLSDGMLEDASLVARRYASIRELGRGVPDFLCVGSGEDVSALESALFPSGVLLADRLEPFAAVATESIARAFYRVPATTSASGRTAVPYPNKPNAYSWIKSPRYQSRPMESGAYARLVITYLSGARMARPEFVDELERIVGTTIRSGNTVGGRMLARGLEAGNLAQRAETLLDQIDPSQPTVAHETSVHEVSGEGLGLMESPAGALQHRLFLERGRLVHYDIVTGNTWNGGATDGEGRMGSLETGLNRTGADLTDPAQQRVMSRIVQSFAFSACDAVH